MSDELEKCECWVLLCGGPADPFWDRKIHLTEEAAIEALKQCEGFKPKNVKVVIQKVRLQTEDKAQAGRRWIKCSERLPELEQQVLLCVDGQIGVFTFTKKSTFGERDNPLFKADVSFISGREFDEDYYEVDYITHWMPLPLPPKED